MQPLLYRIIDSWTLEILADAMTHAQCQQIFEQLELENPHIDLEIESYTTH